MWFCFILHNKTSKPLQSRYFCQSHHRVTVTQQLAVETISFSVFNLFETTRLSNASVKRVIILPSRRRNQRFAEHRKKKKKRGRSAFLTQQKEDHVREKGVNLA